MPHVRDGPSREKLKPPHSALCTLHSAFLSAPVFNSQLYTLNLVPVRKDFRSPPRSRASKSLPSTTGSQCPNRASIPPLAPEPGWTAYFQLCGNGYEVGIIQI
jgi:hypothetical protein